MCFGIELLGEMTPLSLDLFTKFIYATKADDDKMLTVA